MGEIKGYVIHKGVELVLTSEEYDYLITENVMSRIVFENELMGFYMVVDTVDEFISDNLLDLEEDDEETALIKGILAKLKPFEGQALFIP
jgi:hypothetical protein